MAIYNNALENVIRPFVVGRKNWLFAGSPEGAKAMATLYSLTETAKANGWEPYAYLGFLLDHLSNDIGGMSIEKYCRTAQPIPTSFYVGEDHKRYQELLNSQPATI